MFRSDSRCRSSSSLTAAASPLPAPASSSCVSEVLGHIMNRIGGESSGEVHQNGYGENEQEIESCDAAPDNQPFVRPQGSPTAPAEFHYPRRNHEQRWQNQRQETKPT